MDEAVELIRSRDNPVVRRLIRLASSVREQRRSRATIVEGVRLVSALRDSGRIATVLAIGESAHSDPAARRVFESAPAERRIRVADSLLRHISQVVTSSGLLAVVAAPEPRPAPARIGTAILVEGVQDPGNLGSLLRSAAASGIRDVFLSRGSAFAWAPKVLRAGMGAHFSIDIHEGVAAEDIAARADGAVIAATPHARDSLYDLDLTGPVLWVFGSEAAGLSNMTLRFATHRVAIPMPGPVESLNIASAAAICLFEQARQRGVSARAPDRTPA